MKKRLYLKTFLVLLSFLLQAGCAELDKELGLKRIELKSKDEALVFGKLLFYEDGRRREYSWTGLPSMTVLKVESEEVSTIEVDFDGYFYRVVPRGTYVVRGISYMEDFRVPAAFQVPYGADAYYIGDLIIDLQSIGKGRREKRTIISAVKVEDDFYSAMDVFIDNHGYFKGRIDKRLMVHDSSIPTRTADITELTEALKSIGMSMVRKEDRDTHRSPFLEMHSK